MLRQSGNFQCSSGENLAVDEKLIAKSKLIKKELKTWEQQFTRVHSRKPNKHDIAAIPEISMRYKAYGKLKVVINSQELAKKSRGFNAVENHEEKVVITDLKGVVADKAGLKDIAVLSMDHSVSNKTLLAENDVILLPEPPKIWKSSVAVLPISKSEMNNEGDGFTRRVQQQQKAQIEACSLIVSPTLALEHKDHIGITHFEKDMLEIQQRKAELDLIVANDIKNQKLATEANVESEFEPAIENSVVIPLISKIVRVIASSASSLASAIDNFQEAIEDEHHSIEEVTSHLATAPSAKSDNQIIVPNQTPILVALPSVIIMNLFHRIDSAGIMRCKVIRRKSLLGNGQPTYYLYNEADNCFLMAAKKVLLTKDITYIISSSPDEISKHSEHYVGKLKANFMRTQFILSDRRSLVSRELACVSYSKNVLPRELKVGISATTSEDGCPSRTTDITTDFNNSNVKCLFFMKNKAPRWNEATQSHCLNFGGRVTQPSIKNMQLVSQIPGEGYNILQFGKCGSDNFTLDVRWPLTAIEGFGIALSTFDAYDIP